MRVRLISPSPVPCPPRPLWPLHPYGDCSIRFIQRWPRLPKECLGPIEACCGLAHRLQPASTGRRAGRAAGNPAAVVPVYLGIPRSAASAGQGSAGWTQDSDALMQRLTCAVSSVCILPRLPLTPAPASSPAQPSLIHHRPPPKLLSSPVAPSTPPSPEPDTLRYPNLVILQSSSHPPPVACGRALFPSPDCRTSNLPTCTGGSRNPRTPNPKRRSIPTTAALPRNQLPLRIPPNTSTWLLEDPLAPEAWATDSRSSSWSFLVCFSNQSGGGRSLSWCLC